MAPPYTYICMYIYIYINIFVLLTLLIAPTLNLIVKIISEA